MVRQQTWPNWRPQSNNHGHLFIGTHGRGIWKSETLAGPVYADEYEEYIRTTLGFVELCA